MKGEGAQVGDPLVLVVSGNQGRSWGEDCTVCRCSRGNSLLGSSSRAQIQQGSSFRSARFPDCCLWRGALSFPTSERLFRNPWQKTHQCLALFPEMDQFDLVWTTIPVMMLTGNKAPVSRRASVKASNILTSSLSEGSFHILKSPSLSSPAQQTKTPLYNLPCQHPGILEMML